MGGGGIELIKMRLLKDKKRNGTDRIATGED